MANQEHLDVLIHGVKRWNQWRQEHPDIQPDLTGAMLNGNYHRRTDLAEVDFTNTLLKSAQLVFAHLTDARLSGANLMNADLSEASLSRANLSRADLSRADLTGVNFSVANLTEANLTGVRLFNTDFSWAKLRGLNLTQARMMTSIFGDVDLSQVKGLETVIHGGPTIIGIDTIYRSNGNIPEVFLKGAGVDDTFITYIRSLVGKPLEYYSCFISYSSKDEAFAKRLYADLQSNNVRCWFAPEDLKWGARTRPSIDEAIRLHDKLLIILSKSSVASGWVEHEVKTALTRERKEKRTVLFPVRVDKAVFESPLSWATEICHERNIGDFTQWKNHDEYQKAFSRLLRDLKAEA